jgi:hypothetical protein
VAYITVKRLNKSLVLAILTTLCGATNLGSCTTESSIPPAVMTISPNYVVSINQLMADYTKDRAAADAVYAGRRYDFGQVRADWVNNSYFAGQKSSEDYILVEDVMFKPYNSADMKGIIQGTIFEVVGDVQGYQSGYIVVDNCWFHVISGGRPSTDSGEGLY